MHGQNMTHGTEDCFELNRRKKRAKFKSSRNEKDKVTYKDLNAFVNAKVSAALNKAKKKQKKEKEVEINAFNQFRSLNVDSSDEEGELKDDAAAYDSDSGSEASRLLSDASDSEGSVEVDTWLAGHGLATKSNDNNGKIDHVINYCLSFSKTELVRVRKVAGSRRPPAKSKEEPLVPIVFVTMKIGSETITLKALLDSGAGASLMAEKHCDQLKTANKKASFKTVAGKFHTAGEVKAVFQLTELNPTAKIEYKLHVANTLGVYDMILGRDILKNLGIILNHANETII